MSFLTFAVVSPNSSRRAGPVVEHVRRPRVPLHLIQPVERNIEFVRSGEFEHQEVAVEVLDREPAQSLVFGDAVLHVHHEITDVQIL